MSEELISLPCIDNTRLLDLQIEDLKQGIEY